MLPILQIGPLAIQTSGLVLLLGLWGAMYVSERFAPQRELEANKISNLIYVILIGGVIGARMGTILTYPRIFLANPLNVFALNPGLFDPWSGAAFGMIIGLIYGNRKHLPFWNTLDILTPAFAILLISSSLASLASGKAYGAPTSLPWAIWLWGAARHPSQVYELISHILIFWLVYPNKRLGQKSIPGNNFLYFLALFSTVRIFLEAFRGDSVLLPGGLRIIQVFAWFVLAISLWLIGVRLRHVKA